MKIIQSFFYYQNNGQIKKSIIMSVRIISLLGIAILFSSCGVNTDKSDMPKKLSDIHFNEYTINNLPYDERPYVTEYVRSFTMDAFDQDSVPMYVYEGTAYYHPVYTSRFGISFVDGAVRDGDPDYLKLAERIAKRLVKNSRAANDKFLFPYHFDYKYSRTDFMNSPWYSGMAQGRILTLFTRLYDVTENRTYLSWADSTFESLKLLKNQNTNEDWVGYIDEDNYYWIEEYPSEESRFMCSMVLFLPFMVFMTITLQPRIRRHLSCSMPL